MFFQRFSRLRKAFVGAVLLPVQGWSVTHRASWPVFLAKFSLASEVAVSSEVTQANADESPSFDTLSENSADSTSSPNAG